MSESHQAADCENTMTIYDANTPSLPPDEAWSLMVAADSSKESVPFRFALDCYTRSMPKLTFPDIEEALRGAGFNFHLIAKEQEIPENKTVANLQGAKGQKYVVSFQFSYKPTRPKFAAGWPASAEDNMQRLVDAGYVMDLGTPICRNCEKVGHVAKHCHEERAERTKPEVLCLNCKQAGHYIRDCTEPRSDRSCRNCKQPGHKAADCTESRNLDDVECRSCGLSGHFSTDCPSRQPFLCRNCGDDGHKASHCPKERVMICRNCDGKGHQSRGCPEPRDYSRVKCNNCGQMGHTRIRCKEPVTELTEDFAATSFHEDQLSTGATANHDFEYAPTTAAATDTNEWADGAGAGAAISSEAIW